MATRKIIIIGGKGTAVNIAENILDARSRFGLKDELLGFAIDDESLGSAIAGIPVVGKTERMMESWPQAEVAFIFALFKPDRMAERVKLLKSYRIPKQRLYTFIHPSAYIAPSATIGYGSAILAHASISHNVRVGSNCIINAGVVVEHDSVIGDFNFIAAAACLGAAVETGDGVFIGLNATIREELSLGDYGFVGMGSVVTRDVPAGAVVYGVPAKDSR